MFPMDRKPIPVVVEFTRRGQRVKRRFESSHSAKRFYAQAHREGRNPKILQAGKEVEQ